MFANVPTISSITFYSLRIYLHHFYYKPFCLFIRSEISILIIIPVLLLLFYCLSFIFLKFFLDMFLAIIEYFYILYLFAIPKTFTYLYFFAIPKTFLKIKNYSLYSNNYFVLHHYDNMSILFLSLKVGRCVEHPKYYLAISLNLFIFIF